MGLETVLAVNLLERRRSGSFLTPLGSVLLPRVQRLFAHIQSALCDPTIGASLSGRHPVSYLLSERVFHVVDGPYEVLLDTLRAGDLDLLFGVLRRPAWATDVREECLFSNPYAVFVGRQHPLTLLYEQ